MINKRKIKYGERYDEATGKVVKDAAEQKVIATIIEHRDQYLGASHIAGVLNDLGLKAKRGGKWYSTSVQAILDRLEPMEEPEANAGRDAPLKVSLDEEYICDDGTVLRVPVGASEDLRAGRHVDVGSPDTWDAKEQEWSGGVYGSMNEEDFKNEAARKLAEKRLTVLERAERIEFSNPQATQIFGVCCSPWAIGFTAEADATETVKALNDLIDQIKDQPTVKRALRNEVKAVFRELAAERQFHLHLLQRLHRQKSEAQ